MWFYILQGIGYGLAAAAQPGPLQTYLISQTLLKGWRRTLPASLAPLISDGPIVALSLLVISQVPAWLQRFLYAAGGLFVLYLAYRAYQSWKDFDADPLSPETEPRQSLLKAALINVLNPNPYIIWSLVLGPIFLAGWRERPVNGLGFLGGFYVTMILSLCATIIVFGSARQLGARLSRTMLGLSAIALFCFGLYQLWKGIVL
ncbi:MAG: LysE family transporter [Anaerolineales bacterium]